MLPQKIVVILHHNNAIMTTKKELTSVDVFKFVAALMVVALHTKPFASFPETDYWVTALCRIAVPFFFVVSSFFYFKSNKPIAGYLKRLAQLYVVWLVIESPIVYMRFFANSSFIEGLKNFMIGLFLNNTFLASWYLMALLLGMWVVYLLSKWSPALLYVVGVLCAVLSVSHSAYFHLSDSEGWSTLTAFASKCFASNSFIAAIPYCILGRYLALREECLLKKSGSFWFLLVAFVGLAIVELSLCKHYRLWSMSDSYFLTDSFLSLYPVALVLTVLLLAYNLPVNKEASRMMRKMSILVYLSHPVIATLLMKACGMEHGMTLYLCSALISAPLSFAIVKLSNKIPLLKYLY